MIFCKKNTKTKNSLFQVFFLSLKTFKNQGKETQNVSSPNFPTWTSVGTRPAASQESGGRHIGETVFSTVSSPPFGQNYKMI